MGLFDNIFLDQDTPTAMLDALLTDEQKQEQANAKKQEEKKATTPVAESEVQAEKAMEEVSFDDVADTSATPETFTPSGFLGTHDETNTASEDLSFDIGGIDLPSFGDSETATTEADGSGSFLTGGAPIAADEVTFMDNSSVETTDASIALVQGATSATSDSIMDTTSTDPQGKTEETTLVSIGMPEEVTLEDAPLEVSLDALTGGDTTSNSLLDMLSPSSEEATEMSLVDDAIDTTTAEEIQPIDTLMDDTTDTILDTPLMDTSLADVVTSTDTAELVAGFGMSKTFEVDSPLHEMLSEFIAKLEKFNQESATLDTEMLSTESSLTKEEQDLKKEYEVRMSAIEYKRKHMEIERTKRSEEKTRLERIIANLKTEIA